MGPCSAVLTGRNRGEFQCSVSTATHRYAMCRWMDHRDSDQPPVSRRIVLHCGGFELVEPELLDRRLNNGMEKFPPLWGIAASRSAPTLTEDGAVIGWDVTAHGPNWRTTTRFT